MRSEIPRKSVHIAMGAFALLLRYLTWWQAAIAAALAIAFNLFALHRLTGGGLLRRHERERRFSLGIALYPLAVLVLVLVFRNRLELAAAAWALLAFGDGMATLAGLGLGGPRLPWNRDKSWSGFAAFVLFGGAGAVSLIVWCQRALDAGSAHVGTSFRTANGDPDWTLLLAACGVVALLTAFAESVDGGIDDNVVVPLVGGSLLFAATFVSPALLAGARGELAANLGWGAAVNATLAALAFAARSVGASGAIGGFVLATALYTFAGWRGFVIFAAFFVLGSTATRVGFARKQALGVAQERGGRRGAKNAIANTAAAVLFAFLAAATPHHEAFLVAMAAALATAASDTVASEIGQAFGRRHFLVTSLRRVPAGTDGAISMEGTLAGVAASLVLAGMAAGLGLVGALGSGLIVLGAFVGTTLESYVGAAFDGAGGVDNEMINFANTVAGGVTALVLFLALRSG